MGRWGKTYAIVFAVLCLTSLLTVFPAIPAKASSTAPSIEWQQNYVHTGYYDNTGIESASNVIQTSDGGYAFMDLGWSYQFTFVPSTVFKVDSSGNIQWKETIDFFTASTIVQTSDEGYEIAGQWNTYGTTYEYTPTLIKTDSQGNIQWVQNFSSSFGRHLVFTNDGGFIVLSGGGNPDLYPGTSKVILTKITPQGAIQWNCTYLEPANFSLGSIVIQAADGGYAVVGSTSFNGTNDSPNLYYWLFKTDSAGTLIWSRQFGNGPLNVNENDKRNLGANNGVNRRTFGDNEGLEVTQTADGGFVVAGIIYSETATNWWSNKASTFLVKTNSQGKMEWNKTFDGYGTSAIIQTSDGGLVFGAAGIIKIDLNGNTQWEKNLTYPTIDSSNGVAPLSPSSIIETSDGALAVLGVGYNLADNPRTGKIYLIKTEAFMPLPSPTKLPNPMPTPITTINKLASLQVIQAIAITITIVIGVGVCLLIYRKHRKTAK